MQFNRIGSFDIVTRVTGPTHHFLGIETTPGHSSSPPSLESVSLEDVEVREESLTTNETLYREVLAGVEAANGRRKVPFRVTRIRFCREDQPITGVYRMLTEALIEHLDTVGSMTNPPADYGSTQTNGSPADEALAQRADKSFQAHDVRMSSRHEK